MLILLLIIQDHSRTNVLVDATESQFVQKKSLLCAIVFLQEVSVFIDNGSHGYADISTFFFKAPSLVHTPGLDQLCLF